MVSRADRLAEVLDKMDWGTIETAQSEVECLKEELQNWLDNMPENLQSSNKADELQTAIDDLEDIESELQTIVDSIQEQANRTVEFPSMMG
jgi:hypothetical protein